MVIGTKMQIGMEIMVAEEAIIITMEVVMVIGIKMSTEMETIMAEVVIIIMEEEVVLAEVLQAKEGLTGLMEGLTGLMGITGVITILTRTALDMEEVVGMNLVMVHLVRMVRMMPLIVTKVFRILLRLSVKFVSSQGTLQLSVGTGLTKISLLHIHPQTSTLISQTQKLLFSQLQRVA